MGIEVRPGGGRDPAMNPTVIQFTRLLPWIRSQFPQIDTLRDGRNRVYLDNAAGTLAPQSVADAMAEAALWANPQPGRGWPGSAETSRAQERLRDMLRDFLNAAGEDRVYLSESTTASLYKLREALESRWSAADNVVVTDCDHFASISAWEWRARWEVRRARMLPDGHLDPERMAALLDGRTRVVAVTMASNGLGTVLRLPEAVRLVRERAPEALIVVDAVHAAPHLPIDFAALGVDALAFSTYKLFGPFAGVLCLRAELLERLRPYHVEPHTDPETLMEWGTLNTATVSGTRAALEYLQRLGERLEPAFVGELKEYPRERRLYKVALTAIREYEGHLGERLLPELGAIPGVTLYGVTDAGRARERVPTFAFSVSGVEAGTLEQRLWAANRVQVADSDHYAASITRGLGLRSVGRASFAHYNSADDAAAFLHAVRAVTRAA